MSKVIDFLLAAGWSQAYYGHECGSLLRVDGLCGRLATWGKPGTDQTYCWQHAYKQARIDHWEKKR